MVALAAAAGRSTGTMVTVCLLAAAALLWPGVPKAAEVRRTRWLVVLALVGLTLATGPRLAEFVSTPQVRVWNVYHYYLGAKYFRELGYTDLYDATLAADSRGEDYWREIERVRDLTSYEIVDRRGREGRLDPESLFEPQRWETFRSEVEALSGHRPPRAWRSIFVDRGYNATPVWTVVGSALAHLAPADSALVLKLLCSLDLVLLGLTLLLVRRTFGLRGAALVLLLLTVSPVNADRLVGGFLQYDWFCALTAGFCWYRQRRPVAAAAAMSYAVMTRIFPVLFVVAALVPLAPTWLRTRRLPLRTQRFALAFAFSCGLLFVLGLANGRGLGGWREWVSGISVHKQSHVGGQRRIGLEHLFTWEPGAADRGSSARRRASEARRGWYAASAGLLLAAFLWVAWRQRTRRALLLGLVPIYALVVTSRYYWSYLALLPLAGGRRGPPAVRMRWLAAAQLLLFTAFYLWDAAQDGHYMSYLLFNALLLLYLVFTLGALNSRSRP